MHEGEERVEQKLRESEARTRYSAFTCFTGTKVQILTREERVAAVIFNFDRATCEKLAFGFNDMLSKAEEVQPLS